jgi:hypothetical protein
MDDEKYRIKRPGEFSVAVVKTSTISRHFINDDPTQDEMGKLLENPWACPITVEDRQLLMYHEDNCYQRL